MTPKERYLKLKEHLSEENPVLVEVIDEYEKLDETARALGFLTKNQTFTESISWWPLISVLGTFSAGKSSFINEFLGKKVQQSGNQAVDEKFTVLCYSKNEATLPGVALDADPRFPFYNISKEIEKIEGSHSNINRYLQLKTVNSQNLKGKILIDSPGFDADTQRDATLKITSHIIDLSDLILIFFDARHPEPGAMRDTLNHLVEVARSHTDSDKVLYILNQVDTCSKEDNLEDIIGSWQRALSQKGVVSGTFYAIYNENAAKAEGGAVDERLKRKKDEDLAKIYEKIEKVVVDRAYRIVKNIETRVKELKEYISLARAELAKFRKRMLFIDAILLLAFGVALYYISSFVEGDILFAAAFALFLALAALHFKIKAVLSDMMAQKISNPYVKNSFAKFTRWYVNYISAPLKVGRKKYLLKLDELVNRSKSFIQRLNDQFLENRKSEAYSQE